MAQDASTTCWLTCYRMMYKWKGISDTGLDTIVTAAGIKMFDNGSGAKEKGLQVKD